MTALSLSNASAVLGGRQALKGVSLAANHGELIGLVGPNGAGKTTLLRLAAGLLTPSGGEAELEGADPSRLAPKTRALDCAYLPQRRTLAWPMAARRVVELARAPYGGPLRGLSDEDEAAVSAALAAAGAAEFAERSMAELSGGEAARVLLARSLASDACVLLLDEPCAALDPRWQIDAMKALAARADSGALVIAALHDLRLARRFCSRLVVLDQGAVAADGAPDKALSKSVLKNVFALTGDDALLA